MTSLRWLGATLLFVSEMAMLVAIGWWGFHVFDGVVQWIVGLGLPYAVITIWGLFLAPRARVRPPRVIAIISRIALPMVGAALFWLLGAPVLAIIQAVAVIVGTVLTWEWVAPPPPPRAKGRKR